MLRRNAETYHITGNIINLATRKGLPALRVEAWDKDLIFDDLLGSAMTDADGAFVIQFGEGRFSELLLLDPRPDLYFKVFRGDRLLRSTEDSVLWNVDMGETKIIIEIPQDAAQETEKVEPDAQVSSTSNLNDRLAALNVVLSAKKDRATVKKAFEAHNGNVSAALESLKDQPIFEKLAFANTLAIWADDQLPVVKALSSQTEVKSLRDIALHFDAGKLANILDAKAVPESAPGTTPAEKKVNYAAGLQNKLFAIETSAVLQRMLQSAEIPIPDAGVRDGVVNFLNNQPAFNIRKTSVYIAFKQDDAFKGIPDELRPSIIEQLKTLQRVQAISPTPAAVPLLIEANLTSAARIAEIPETTFMSIYAPTLGGDVANQVYTQSINIKIRNEHLLMSLHETLRGSGIEIIDGKDFKKARESMAKRFAEKLNLPSNLDTLFSDMDTCECGDCRSVYSPAAYFVELLQFLRNNNLGPDPTNPNLPNPNIHPGIAGTPLEKLFRRRPDLGCLELTCENTDTVLPYVDLVNEVMESFIVHLDEYKHDTYNPKQAKLEVFNVDDETSSELLAQPQHTNYEAYNILKSAVSPFTLPYHQPIDATRIFLNYLGTSRYELLKHFRTAKNEARIPYGKQAELASLHKTILDRAAEAEFLGLTEEEYVILTKQAFWPKNYFDLSVNRPFITEKEYQAKIGVKSVHIYYGYENEHEMSDTDEGQQTGLYFVKKQFLPRTGIQYTDLVDLLKTRWINPNYPQGKALKILEEIRFSYRFLQSLVDTENTDPKARFAKLIEFLETEQPLPEPDPCQEQKPDSKIEAKDLRHWVYCNFENIGELIVLESGESSQPQVEDKSSIGPLSYVANTQQNIRGKDRTWFLVQDCDLDKVRLMHLNGTAITTPEYDCIQRFIRLWRKLGWTIDETDKALAGLAMPANLNPDNSKDDCVGPETGEDCGCPDQNRSLAAECKISPEFLSQLVSVKKLLNLSGLPLLKLLTFWADISTNGEKSLYSSLFLTHNLIGIDPVFKSDSNGNYLTQSAKLEDHLPVLMATLKLKSDDVVAIQTFCHLDVLTLPNVSELYRYSLLIKALGIKAVDLPSLVDLFGNPFISGASQTLKLFKTWGEMEDAGFTFAQLNYMIKNQDNPLRPMAPSIKTILQVAKTLNDGLNAIDHDHPDIPNDKPEQATSELVRAEASLVFDQTTVENIIGLLEGTTIYITNAPPNLDINIPVELGKKLKYIKQTNAKLQVTGILTEDEKTNAMGALAQDTPQNDKNAWSDAIDRINQQPLKLYDAVLSSIFPSLTDVTDHLLLPDIQNTDFPDQNTAPAKRLYFLHYFLLFLREQLARRLVVDTMANTIGLPKDVTDTLLSEIIKVGDEFALSALDAIRNHPANNPNPDKWSGCLIPLVDGDYSFVATVNTGSPPPGPLVIDGLSIAFTIPHEDPSNVWSTNPTQAIRLKAGRVYKFVMANNYAEPLQWKMAISPASNIPASALLPDYLSDSMKDIFGRLRKAALLINGFNLSADEIEYWQLQRGDFDFNSITLQHWKWLARYVKLRNSLPRTETSLLDLFKWAANNPIDGLSGKIAAATNWKRDNINKLLASEHFDLNRSSEFRDETNLIKLQKALAVVDKIGVDINRLFEWAKPSSDFSVCHNIAESIRQAIRTRFDQDAWEQAIKPLNDRLRENQKQALINYLLVQEDLIDWGVTDADGLFEFFLIDVQMDPCMETSRIKQAISSVQLFVQRCLLGLEEERGIPNGVIDRNRWDWMQRYRVWEANRKVFLYPENWIQPQLRDDKSPFYKELESELLQKDINKQTVEDALKSYLFKVDEVANLKVVGIFLEQGSDQNDNPAVDSTKKPVYIKLHVFARTRNAPYFFHYRYFDVQESNWYAWEKVQVDIPSYDAEDTDGRIWENGTYLIPVVWNKRLLIFFPQFMKKTAPAKITIETKKFGPDNHNYSWEENSPTNQELGQVPGDYSSRVSEFWEIKLAWSEYRNGKWLQKQVTRDVIYDSHLKALPPQENEEQTQRITLAYTELPSIESYQFVPRLYLAQKKVVIDVYQADEVKGSFYFMGSQTYLENSQGMTPPANRYTIFHYSWTKILHSFQALEMAAPTYQVLPPYFDLSTITEEKITNIDNVTRPFCHSFIHEILGKLTTGNFDSMFVYYQTKIFDIGETFGADSEATYHELKRSYSLYNWEAAFHAPMQLVDRLLKSQQFEQAIKMCHYVFNPLAQGDDPKRFWQFIPFTEINTENVLERLFLGLQPSTPNSQINEWRDKPFQPHVIARHRPAAYMKWVVMKYIEILIAWGDYLFRQDTIESINQATQLYVLASHIYGPRGQKIPKRSKIQAQTYNSLLDKWDAFGNAMKELELIGPFSNQTSFRIGISNGRVGLANVFGFATTLYFCIPNNPQLEALRNTIDDRLFKIRHCENIEGVFRKLPLFESPIDPALLVQAAAQGINLSSILNDLNSPMPNYRFYYLLQKALELCSELKALGSAFLSAKEKGDAEALSRLRAGHESAIHNLVMEVKKQQLEEASKSLEALQQNRKGPVYRLQHYLKLIGEDLAHVPNNSTDFSELPTQIEQPVDESGLKVSPYEKEEMDRASDARGWQIGVGTIEALASIFHAIPNTSVDTKPWGIGAGLIWGGMNLGNVAQAVARSAQIVASDLSYQSTNAGRKGGFLRQIQDRVQQANVAGYEIKNIDKQILTQQVRISIANLEIANQQKQIDNAQEVEDFLRSKYTNQELYSWMEDQVRSLYYQAYTLAYELAQKAERTFRFERGLSTSNFIQFGYWDASHDGLLSGEKLYIGLKQLEAAYQEKRGYDFEISKPISLRQINPIALLELRENGICEFDVPEVLFDMDYPGHYMRRIKSVALTVPCVVGPYTSLNCTLRLLEHKFRVKSIAASGQDYLEEETDERFSTTNIPISSIAVSTGQNDSGVFELNFRDERYIPFEGAGVISKWRIEFPKEFKQFDYETISDVILHLRYTSVDGGDKLKGYASTSVQNYIASTVDFSQQEGLFAVFDLIHDFPSEWYQAMHPTNGANERQIILNNLNDRLPIFTKGYTATEIQATDVYFFPPEVARSDGLPLTNWQLKITVTATKIKKLWLVIRYKLIKESTVVQ